VKPLSAQREKAPSRARVQRRSANWIHFFTPEGPPAMSFEGKIRIPESSTNPNDV
jgi:hypothetical protein